MGFFSGFSKKSSERVLVLHIGSATVEGAFVEIENGVTTMSAAVTISIPVVTDLAFTEFEKHMQKSLVEALGALAKFRMPAPSRVDVYFSSPWYASQIRVAKMSRPTSFVVTKTLMNDMISRELKAFEDNELTKSTNAGQPLRALESKVIQAKLNGYATPNPIGVSAREIEFSIFLTVAHEELITMVEDTIRRDYHMPISFSTFLSASFLVTRDFFPHLEDYLLIDIGGEVTDVSLVRESTIVRSVSFPRGRNFILRKLSEGLKRGIPESLAICTLYTEGKVEESIKNACATILQNAKDEWLDSFQKAIFADSNELSIPDTVLLSVDADIAPWFIETIRREEFHRYSLTEKEFKVVVLDAEIFHRSLRFKENVPRIPFLMIEALASAS